MRRVFVALILLATGTLLAADELDITGAMCPVGGSHAVETISVDYRGGKVYFCCGGCDSSFLGDPGKYAAKANQQLVVTGQAKQTASPLSGKAVNAAYSLELGGAKVLFASEAERDGVAAQEEAAQVEAVFNDEAFDKGFQVGD